MLNICWYILGLPLAAAALITFVIIPAEKASANKAGFRSVSAWLSVLSITGAFALSLIVTRDFYSLEGHRGEAFETSLTWMTLPYFRIEIGLLLNGLSLLMLLLVTGIAALVAIFSSRYMKGDEGYSRYFAALSFFAFAMLGIVLANNLIQIFIFWELVGVASYLLIGFWFEKPSASIASKKGFLTTRVGDVGMMLGILLLFGLLLESGAGTFNFLELETKLHQTALPAGLLTLACIGIFFGAVGKSAQVPLHVWLPDAMEGPTPASALIHAATMVAAGVFMVTRLFFLFEMSPAALQFIAWTGGITALVAALIAVVQNDIKRVLAYSTLSQLGYMIMALGVGSPEASMFHLTTHAFFKALLFLAAGSLIHALHSQEIWAMSSVIRSSKSSWPKKLPITGLTFIIGTAALAGLPFTSGFFSKEEILGAASAGPQFLFWMALAVVFLTAFYMGRVVTIIFGSSAATTNSKQSELHEDNVLITLPLIILAVFSLIAGYLPFKTFLESYSRHDTSHPAWLAAVSVGLAVLGLILSFVLYRKKTAEKHLSGLQGLVNILKDKFYFDRFYDWLITHVQENIARATDTFEQFVFKGGAQGLADLTQAFGKTARRLQNGWIQSYGLIFVLGFLALMVYLLRHGAAV